MQHKDLSALTNEELLAEAKKRRLQALAHAFVIGVMVAIVGYSFLKNTWGLVTLIPVFFIYRLTKKTDNSDELNALLKERQLL